MNRWVLTYTYFSAVFVLKQPLSLCLAKLHVLGFYIVFFSFFFTATVLFSRYFNPRWNSFLVDRTGFQNISHQVILQVPKSFQSTKETQVSDFFSWHPHTEYIVLRDSWTSLKQGNWFAVGWGTHVLGRQGILGGVGGVEPRHLHVR